MPWVGVCRKCKHFEIGTHLGSIRFKLRRHFNKIHPDISGVIFPSDMNDMNKEVEIDVSPNFTGFFWTSKQYIDDNMWLAVLTNSDTQYLETRVKEGKPEKVISYLKSIYEAPVD